MTKKIITIFIMVFSMNLMAGSIPTPPTNLGAYNFTETTARLSFKDLSDNETGFKVYHNGNMLARISAKSGVGQYQYKNIYHLNSCTLYNISIVAYNDNGESRHRFKSFRTKGCTTTEPVNQAPIAKAGVDRDIILGDTITIEGEGVDSDGTISSYLWKKGTETISTTSTLTYSPTAIGTEILTLIVTDNKGATGSDSVNITISQRDDDNNDDNDDNNDDNDNNDGNNDNSASSIPVAPQNIGAYNFTNTTARLSFKDFADNEDGFKVYHNGNQIAHVGAKEGTEKYQYINIGGLDVCTLYSIKLVAYNNKGESAPLSKSFKTTGCDTLQPRNHIPTVNVGANRTIFIGDSIDIIGDASDSDGHITTYIWKKGNEILGNSANLNYRATTKGIDTLTLTVTDDKGATASDSLQIFVNDPADIDNNNNPVDITLFGAIPNDNIDDTEAIRDALAVSGSITMPTGVYNVKGLTRVGKTIIDGNGSTFKTERSVRGTSNNILKLKTELDSDRIWIKNLTLDGDCPTQYPTIGDYVISLIHIYDSKNIILEGIFVKDYSSQYPVYQKNDMPEHQIMNLNHSLDMHYTIFITFSRDIILRNIEQKNIKIEGPLVYESDNILIENFKSTESSGIWTALHVVASDNITMKHVNVSDGSVTNIGSSVNFVANHHFTLFDVNTTNKNGFDISNEIINVPSGRVLRDTSYGTFTNCRFEAFHPVQAYPTKNRHESLSFFNTKFIPSRVENGANAIRFQKAGELLFDNCTFGSRTIMTNYPMILGNTQKLTIKNSVFLNTSTDPSIETGSIYIFGGEYGDLNISNNSFTGISYTPIVFRKVLAPPYENSNGKVHELRFLNNIITDERELKYNNFYKIYGLTIDNIITD